MEKFRALPRGIWVFFLMVTHMMPGVLKSIFSKDFLPLALRMRQLWAIRSLKTLGIKVDLNGSLPIGGPFIFIGNHRSYIDPVVALRDILALPVAKAEVSSWPIIGYAAKATGVMWVKRDSKNSRASTLKAMEKTLNDGFSVLIYPEGTTHIDPVTRTFLRGAFRLSATMGIPVLPIAMEFHDQDDAFIDDDKFGSHFVKSFGKKNTHVKVEYGNPIKGDDPEELLEQSQKWIDGKLIEMRKEIGLDVALTQTVKVK